MDLKKIIKKNLYYYLTLITAVIFVLSVYFFIKVMPQISDWTKPNMNPDFIIK